MADGSSTFKSVNSDPKAHALYRPRSDWLFNRIPAGFGRAFSRV